MGKVAVITIEQYRQIAGKEFRKDMYYRPTLDAVGNIIIGEEEIKQTMHMDFPWIYDLPLVHKETLIVERTEGEWIEHDKLKAEELLQELTTKLDQARKTKR